MYHKSFDDYNSVTIIDLQAIVGIHYFCIVHSVVTFRGELSYLAPLGSENISAPYFKQCFFWGGGYYPQTESNTTPPNPRTEITNILFYILNLWRRTYCSGLRGCDAREKEIVV